MFSRIETEKVTTKMTRTDRVRMDIHGEDINEIIGTAGRSSTRIKVLIAIRPNSKVTKKSFVLSYEDGTPTWRHVAMGRYGKRHTLLEMLRVNMVQKADEPGITLERRCRWMGH